MVTIISGKYRGRKLKDLPGPRVRPTLARVRKSVMQILEPFTGRSVLDLYAGIGSLGIEALSRGASSVTFVEQNRQIARVLEKNLRTICPQEKYEIHCMDTIRYLQHNWQSYDIILADPPYGQVDYLFLKELVQPFLSEKGIFCMEMKVSPLPEDSYSRLKKYGRTQVVFWKVCA